jgi:hypothetical protein
MFQVTHRCSQQCTHAHDARAMSDASNVPNTQKASHFKAVHSVQFISAHAVHCATAHRLQGERTCDFYKPSATAKLLFTGQIICSIGTATRDGLDGPGDRIPVGARFSAPLQTGPGGPPSLMYSAYRVLPGGKPSSAEVKERVELYLYSTFGPSLPVLE